MSHPGWEADLSGSRKNLRITIATIFLLTVLQAGGCSKTPGRDGRPAYNVLIVTLDTTRADYLSCYGDPRETSPHLDALATDGIRFDRAISTSGNTPVSHASILTGLNPYQHGVRVVYAQHGCHLADSVVTLATMLREEGWQTGAFLSSFTVSEFYGFNQGFETFDGGLRIPAGESFAQKADGRWDWPTETNQRRSDKTTDVVCAWLQTAKRPFFAWVHYWDPHDRLILPPQDVVARFTTPGADQQRLFREVYASEVYYMDSQFGRLIRFLKERGEYERTIVVVVADHGEGLGDHGWWYHRILYQEQIRVPMIIRVPGWPKGKVLSHLVRTVDIVPTILDVLAVQAPSALQGSSLKPLVDGESDSPRVAYAEAINLYDLNAWLVDARPDDGMLYSATDGRWKIIYRPNKPEKSELYDLRADPHETENLYTRESHEAARLQTELMQFDGFVTNPLGPSTDPDILERLRSLGYIAGD
jgi:arylsulfatase A-like enzyme